MCVVTMLSFWILGNNARNLHYIKKRNPRKAIWLANNKLQTKKFLWERGIPFAETYAVIKNRKQLSAFDFWTIPNKNFVIKPNHGSKGRGIMIVKRLSDIKETVSWKEGHWSFWWRLNRFFKPKDMSFLSHRFESSGKLIHENDLKRNMTDILDGNYSLSRTDQVIIEEKLIPGEGFKDFCTFWLADLRIIVFNLVPVAAMIRIPTEKSEGKANLNAWGIGCWIDIWSGKLFSTFHNNKIYTQRFPKGFEGYQAKQIPFWDDILLLSSKVQYFVNLGYLALDRVITTKGPRLLEINARAGLEVQKISDIKLKSVLHKISDLKVNDPEKGVVIAKTLFSKDPWLSLKKNKILYLSQTGKLKITTGEEEVEDYNVIVKVNLQQTNNTISPDLEERILMHKPYPFFLELPDNEIYFKNLKFESWMSVHTIILGQKTASKFLIKPIKKENETINILNPKKTISIELSGLRLIDQKIAKMGNRFNLTKRLKPTNYFSELDRFISAKGKYNPIFEYTFPSLNIQDKRENEFRNFEESLQKSYFKSPLLNLFREKIEELSHKMKLLRAYSIQDFETIKKENIALFGDLNDKLLKISKEKIFENPYQSSKKNNLTVAQIRETIEKHFAEKGIFWVEINESISGFSRVSVILSQRPKINISKNIQLSEVELKSILAHEVDIHLLRYLNGMRSGWNIFKSGTGYYLKDEEGLAIRNSMQFLPENEENLSIYKKYYLLEQGKQNTFSEMVDIMYFLNPNRTLEGIFKSILRIKKWQKNTASKGENSIRMKDKVYLDGFEKIKNAKLTPKQEEQLKKGKVKIEDLEFIL